jgi:hypothetical protein
VRSRREIGHASGGAASEGNAGGHEDEQEAWSREEQQVCTLEVSWLTRDVWMVAVKWKRANLIAGTDNDSPARRDADVDTGDVEDPGIAGWADRTGNLGAERVRHHSNLSSHQLIMPDDIHVGCWMTSGIG